MQLSYYMHFGNRYFCGAIYAKEQFLYFVYWAPFLVSLGWNRVVELDTDVLTIVPVLGICLILNCPCLLQNGWLLARTNLLKTTLNPFFSRNVQLTEWFGVLMLQIKYSSEIQFLISISGQQAMSLPTEINGIYKFDKCAIKHDRNCISLFKMRQIPETGTIVKMSVSTTLFHPRQTRKAAQCWKYWNCPLRHTHAPQSCVLWIGYIYFV